MSTHIGRFRPGLVTALVKVAMIGSWNGRTFLDDNLDLADVADFVPVEPAASVRLPLVDEQPDLVVVRRGSISPEWLARSTGYPVHVPEGVSQAARGRGLTDVELQRSLEQLRPWRDA